MIDFVSQEIKKEMVKSMFLSLFKNVNLDYTFFEIDPVELSENITNIVKIDKEDVDLNFISQSFLYLKIIKTYYEKIENEIMVCFITQSIMEANLNYLEGKYNDENLHFSKKDFLIIENIVSDSL